jgi:hypothetical protein
MKMPLYSFEFEDDNDPPWIIQSSKPLSRETAGEIARSVCGPHGFSSVSFTVYEIPPMQNSQTEWELYDIGEDKKKLFSITAFDIENMLHAITQILSNRDNIISLPGEGFSTDLVSDLLNSLRANTETITQGLDILRDHRRQSCTTKATQPAEEPTQPTTCPFKAWDVVHLKSQPEKLWQVVHVMPKYMVLRSLSDRTYISEEPSVHYNRWQLVEQLAIPILYTQQEDCPFAVGDVIRSNGAGMPLSAIIENPTALAWRIERVLADKIEAASDDHYSTPAHILRKDWGKFSIISKAACPFKLGDTIRSIKWPTTYLFHVTEITADQIVAHNKEAGSNHIIPRSMWNAYEANTRQ